MEHYISAYAISVRNANEDGKVNFNLNAIGSNDLLAITREYLSQDSFKEFHHTEEDKTSFTVGVPTVNDDERIIYGQAKFGKYGIGSTGINTDDNTVSYVRGTNVADTMPHFYFFYIPNGSTYAILLTQRIGISGIYSKITEDYKVFIRNKISSAVTTIDLLKPTAAIDTLSSQRSTQSVTYKTLSLPKDISDAISSDGILNLVDGEYTVEITFKPKRNKILGLMPGWHSKPDTTAKLLLENGNKKTKVIDTKVNIEINGKKRVIAMSNPTSIETYFHIDDDVVTLENGHPTYESLLEYCKTLSKDLHNALIP